ncbi:tetratricopeptide repeat protein [Nocardia mexicana]|uniref:Tetratricopeptide repeat protein n=1 Tax=Nocardia mexicana TaxID=279262 RepID=A0A370H7A4_9NOCA|nr:tetratricopeptide repeat protein [Nocardia mexicana]RDI52094.1 tetratricopeptide repeat protein [Nocardia mexicana]
MDREQSRRDGAAQERRAIRAALAAVGLSERQLIEPLAAELRQRGYRPRVAWRYANNLTQAEVCDRFNDLSDTAGMRPGRISEYEAWPIERNDSPPGPADHRRKGVRPTIRVLKTLAAVYGTTWDHLIDLRDLEHMPETDRREYRDTIVRRATDRRAASAGELPAEIPNFTGRRAAKAELEHRVYLHRRQNGAAVHVIDGQPGVGKTTLARVAVAEFLEHYPDGPVWVDLFGYTPGREPRRAADVLERLLLEIEVPRDAIETDAARRAGQWRAEMSRRRMLIVFDNAADSSQVKDLLPQSPGCFVLITSRSRLLGLSGSVPLHLDVMDWDEAEELLVKLANLHPGHYDKDAVRRIVAVSGRLPLALKLIGRQITHHGEDMLAESASDLTDLTDKLRQTLDDGALNEDAAEYILEWFTAENESVRVAFEVSYRRLHDLELQRTVRLLGWFPGPEISAEPLAVMAGVTPGRAKILIRKLFEAGLLDPVPGPVRYRMHDLNKLCARLRAAQQDPPDDHSAAIDRLVDHALTIARRAHVPGSPDSTGGIEHPAQARDWLSRERELLLGCVEIARSTPASAELARLVAFHLCGRGLYSEAHRLCERSLQIATQLGDRPLEAWALVVLGRVHRLVGHPKQASSMFEAAHAIAVQLADKRCLADMLCERGQSGWLTGRHEEARVDFTDALVLAREIDYRPTECDALDGLSRAHRMACHYAEARACSEDTLSIAFDLDDPERIGTAQWGLAEVLRYEGRHEDARQHYVHALHLARSINHRKLEGDAMRGLGHIEQFAGNQVTARRYFEDALATARRIHDRYGEGWALSGYGRVALAAGNYEEARQNFTRAWELAQEINDPLGCIDALRGLGNVECRLHATERARGYYLESLELARHIGNPRGEADALRALANLTDDRTEACAQLRAALAVAERTELPVAAALRAELRTLGC